MSPFIERIIGAAQLEVQIYKEVKADATATGQAHAQTFDVVCEIEGLKHKTAGTSTSRRSAEQIAAKAFLELLEVTNE